MAHESTWLTFTDDGCRSEIRIGVLLVLVAVFVWLWLGPSVAIRFAAAGLPLLMIGAVLQARDAGRGRPGYPLKLACCLLVFGLFMLPDLSYRESVAGPIHWQPMPILLTIAGAWLLLWWPIATRRAKSYVGAQDIAKISESKGL